MKINLTQRELIQQILDLQRVQGKMQFSMSEDILYLKNDIAEQKAINNRVVGFLENDSKTGTKGLVQLTQENKKRHDDKDKIDAVRVGIFGVIVFVLGLLGSFLIKLFLK